MIISLTWWRKGTSYFSFGLRGVCGHNKWWKYPHVCVCSDICLLVEAVKHGKMWQNKIKAQEKWMKFLSSAFAFMSFCSRSLLEIRTRVFSLWNFCEIWGLVTSPYEKEVYCANSVVMNEDQKYVWNILCLRRLEKAGVLKISFYFSSCQLTELMKFTPFVIFFFSWLVCWPLLLKWYCY